MNDTTIITVSYNAADALALMWESWKFHHPEFKGRWLVFDQGSTDGALEYAKAHADIVLEGINAESCHGDRISELCELVDTEFVVHADNDLEFRGPVLDMLFEPFQLEKVYCSCFTRLYHPVNEWLPPADHPMQYPYGTFDVYGKIWKGMWSPNIALGLMRMDVIRRIQELGITFGYYANDKRQEWFETGGMMFLFAKAMGYEVAELSNLWDHVTHHGSISTLWTGAEYPDFESGQTTPMMERYRNVQENLKALREEVRLAKYGELALAG